MVLFAYVDIMQPTMACEGDTSMVVIYETTDIGTLVRRKRIEQGLTQSQLAGISGKGTRFISELENGKHTMQIGKVIDILHVLGLDISVYERGTLHEA